jgi:hypothetical protein
MSFVRERKEGAVEETVSAGTEVPAERKES